ncbi:condensation domain-containing protein [Pseudoalteromonas ardens]|uniref:condensation domain-containing protein n=1 Tax=Pseudoalteromonas ardens TaxID=3048490 RepID=UPI0024C24445|nr:condensation domain-containing protein [Pseudoalteromonas sp. R96]MDK1314048.1 condensation domain-containing protein [Pseudoalteromonas sp. R96]
MTQHANNIEQQRAELLERLIEQAAHDALPLPAGEAGHPLSYAQQRLWFVEQLEGPQVTYNFPSAVMITGPFDPQLYQQSMQQVVLRHPIMTATFFSVDGVPRQQFHPDHRVQLPLVDLTELSEEAQQAELKELWELEANATFSLSDGPLYHCSVIKLGPEQHVLLMNLHHIITDGWSSSLFNREVSEYYEALVAQREPHLVPLPLEYSDYVYWQQDMLESDAREQLASAWKAHLGGMETLQLPLDRPRTEQLSTRGAHHQVVVPDEHLTALKELAQAQGASLYMVLLAAYKVMLYTYYKQTDIVVGTSSASRKVPEMEQMLGLFVNQLVLRTSLGGNPNFEDIVQRVKDTFTFASAHQDLPFDVLVSEMDVVRQPGQSVLFQSLFLFNNFPKAPLDPSVPVQMERLNIDIDYSRFDLSLTAEEEDALTIKFTYRTDLFDRTTIETMSRRYLSVIAAIVDNANPLLSQIDGALNMEQTTTTEKNKASRFKRGRRKAVNASLQEIVKISDAPGTFPVVIEPATSHVDLVEWIALNRSLIESKIAQAGAILFRGFGVDTPVQFERVAGAYCPELFGSYGDLPKENKGKQIYKSTPYPNDKTIMFHNEGSHTQQWPMKQMFASMLVADQGGETPIVDCREVYRRLEPSVVAKLADKKLMYVRNFIEGLDVSWRDFFKTDDRNEVEKICQEAEIECEWVNDEHLRTKKIANAVCLHPKTGEKLFFNQIQLHHISYMDPVERDSLLTIFKSEDLPRNVYYGDGTEIEPEVIAQINDAYEQSAVAQPWQKGDFLAVDNMLVAHARLPFSGERKVVVAMGELFAAADLTLGEHA